MRLWKLNSFPRIFHMCTTFYVQCQGNHELLLQHFDSYLELGSVSPTTSKQPLISRRLRISMTFESWDPKFFLDPRSRKLNILTLSSFSPESRYLQGMVCSPCLCDWQRLFLGQYQPFLMLPPSPCHWYDQFLRHPKIVNGPN